MSHPSRLMSYLIFPCLITARKVEKLVDLEDYVGTSSDEEGRPWPWRRPFLSWFQLGVFLFSFVTKDFFRDGWCVAFVFVLLQLMKTVCCQNHLWCLCGNSRDGFLQPQLEHAEQRSLAESDT